MTIDPNILIIRPDLMNSLPSTTHDGTDLTSELLMGMRLIGVEYRRIELAPPLGLSFGKAAGLAHFHFVGRGPVHLRCASGKTYRLDTGDAVLMPHGGEHEVVSALDVSPCLDVRELEATTLCPTVTSIERPGSDADAGKEALIFSGCMEFDLGGMQMLVASMPEVMLVATLLDRYPELRVMLEAMERESCTKRAGFAGVFSRLADVVAAFIVRAWVECGCGDATGWVQALRDPRLGKVILAMHRDPGKAWTVANLAEEMGSSRSVFAERFLEVTGMTPVRYLTELRMRLAAQWIGRDRESIESVAFRLGYGSLAAFSRAFKRTIGHPPGAIRGHGGMAHAHT
ncbi:MAG: RCS-specific HTH-type transcriptional activator RclR [Luteibacter sp.]|nr:MAG: RCS-specific HTH-type transcriptional activator RclR [Luteibacter sp.]